MKKITLYKITTIGEFPLYIGCSSYDEYYDFRLRMAMWVQVVKDAVQMLKNKGVKGDYAEIQRCFMPIFAHMPLQPETTTRDKLTPLNTLKNDKDTIVRVLNGHGEPTKVTKEEEEKYGFKEW